MTNYIRLPECPKRPAAWSLAALIAILIFACALRLHKITLQGLWYDELGSLTNATGRMGQEATLPRGVLLKNVPILTSMTTARPPWAVVTSLVHDDHPPLYFLTLRLWMDLFGQSDATVRMLSVVFSVLAIAFLFDAVRLWHSAAAALWACSLMALAVPQIQYAQETRMFAMSLAMETFCLAGLARIEMMGVNSRRIAAIAGGAAGMLLCNYLTVTTCLAIAVYAIVRLRGKTRRTVTIAIISVAIFFLLTCGPLILMQRHIAQHTNFDWEWDHAPGHVAREFLRAASVPFELMQPALQHSRSIAAYAALLFFIPFLLVRRQPVMLLWELLLILPVAFIMVLDLIRQTNDLRQIRYSLGASPAEYVLLAIMLPSLGKFVRPWLLAVVAVIGCIIALPVAYEPYKWDPKPAAMYLGQHVRDDEPIIFAGGSWGPYFTGKLYLAAGRYAHVFPRPVVFLDEPASPQLIAQLRKYSRLWLFCAGTQTIPQLIPGCLEMQSTIFPQTGFVHRGAWDAQSK